MRLLPPGRERRWSCSRARWTAEHCLDVARQSRATVMVRADQCHQDAERTARDARLAAGRRGRRCRCRRIAERWETTTGVPISSFYGSMDAGQLAVASPSDPLLVMDHRRPAHDRASGRSGEDEICMRGDLVQQLLGRDFGPYAPTAGRIWAISGSSTTMVPPRRWSVEGHHHRGSSNINPYEVESMVRHISGDRRLRRRPAAPELGNCRWPSWSGG